MLLSKRVRHRFPDLWPVDLKVVVVIVVNNLRLTDDQKFEFCCFYVEKEHLLQGRELLKKKGTEGSIAFACFLERLMDEFLPPAVVVPPALPWYKAPVEFLRRVVS